jgi:hypothetical protein
MTSVLIAAAIAASASAFVENARASTAKYLDQRIAIADGYKRVGRDFPAMGEHWVRITLVFDGKFDPAHPEVLNYVVVDGKPTLFGVGYAVPLLDGESAPAGPGGAAAWHDHFRTVEDETVLPHHHRGSAANKDGARLAMMHAWIWSPNPDGMFAADNWTLPYRRLGLTPVAGATIAVAKALSLATGGRSYFEMAVDAAAEGEKFEKEGVQSAFDRAQRGVEAVVQSKTIEEAELSRLADIWTTMWDEIDKALSPTARSRISHLPIR